MRLKPLRLSLAVCVPSLAVTFGMLAPQHAEGQQTSIVDTPDYRSTLAEVSRPDARPSRLGSGTAGRALAPTVPLEEHLTRDGLQLQTSAWKFTVHAHPWSFSFSTKRDSQGWRLDSRSPGQPAISWNLPNSAGAGPQHGALRQIRNIRKLGNNWLMDGIVDGLADPVVFRLEASSIESLHIAIRAPQSMDGARLNFRWQAQGPFFGLGERFSEEQVNGIRTTLRPEDLFGTQGHNWTYIPVPFLYSPRGVGAYFDTGKITRFDLSNAAAGAWSVAMERPSTDLYLFGGGSPKDVLREYTGLTGRTPLSPPWAFGVWVCAYDSPETVLATARRLRQERIPTSALWTFDVMDQGDVMGWPLWRTGYYPNIRSLTDKLHGMGFKSLTYVHPYLRNTLAPYNNPNPSYQMAQKKGYMVHDPAGTPTGPRFEPTHDGNIDFTRPEAVAWFETRIRHILLDDGFDGWMEDYGEWINDDDRFASGVKGRDMANLHSLIYHKTTFEISRAAKPDVVEFVRSGYAGSQGYSRVVWGGDQFPVWDHDSGLPSAVAAGITAGLSGFAVWSPDIEENGFSKELWTRWVEFGALTPVMRDHAWDKPAGAVNLWSDAGTVATFKKFAGLHVSLFPYLYTFAKEAETTGLPIMRHPMLEYPEDPQTYNTYGEYLLGDRLLVAPVVTQGALSRAVYLPSGEWMDFWTGASLHGGRSVNVAAPLDIIPVFVKAGSILPMFPSDTQTLVNRQANSGFAIPEAPLIWRVFPADAPTQAHFQAFDGSEATAVTTASTIRVELRKASAPRRQEVVMTLRRSPLKVQAGGTVLPEQPGQLSDQPAAWWFDTATRMLHINAGALDGELLVER